MTGTIGILGGVGPLAGLDLAKKIISHTKASTDQEHINTLMISCPSLIPDRTAFLLSGGDNPAPGIEKCMHILAEAGATAIGLCCNTAHSQKILSQISFPKTAVFINMIDSTCKAIKEKFDTAKIGLLATEGTTKTGIYDEYFSKYQGLSLVKPSLETVSRVHDAIYNKEYGIKATPNLTDTAYRVVSTAVEELASLGCKAVILGCTELPLAFPSQAEYKGTYLVDPTDILACELIKATAPEKLQ